MYIESITLIDEGDEIAFINDLQFEASIFDATEEELATIDWVHVNKAQVTGDLIVLDVTHMQTDFRTKYRIADFVKVLVCED